MPDRRRIVTINPYDGTVTTVKDLEDSTSFFAVRDSFNVKAPKRSTIMAQRQRRYSGAVAAAESHENGAITWQAMVTGTSADNVNANVESMLGVLERANTANLFFEWRPDGATNSTFFDIRGPATWQSTYRRLQYTSTKTVLVDIEIPVGPLAQGSLVTQTMWKYQYLPNVVTNVVNPGMEAGTSTSVFGWGTGGTGTSQALARYATWADSGTYSAKVDATLAANQYVVLRADQAFGGVYVPVVAGSSYTLAAKANVLTAISGATLAANINWYDAGGSYLSTSTGANVSAATTGAKGSVSVTATAPSGATSVQVAFAYQAGSTSGSASVAWDSVSWSAGLTVTGTAPAATDIALRFNGGTAPIWCLIGWTKRPTTPLTGTVAPFGIIEAETGANLSGWVVGEDANTYRAGTALSLTSSSSGSASATWAVDPSTLQPDDFTRGTVDVEVWGRVYLSSTLTSPKMTLSLEPAAGTSFGAPQFSQEYGSSGKLLVKPSSGGAARPVKLGTLTLPVDTVQPLAWNVKVVASWAGASSSVVALDYLVMVPAKQRACSRSGVANDSSYPDFVATTSDTTKLVRSDLSGAVASATGNFGPDNGLGGTPIELPPGEVDVLVWPSNLVPDDPTVDNTSMAISAFGTSGVGGKFYVTPRYFLVK